MLGFVVELIASYLYKIKLEWPIVCVVLFFASTLHGCTGRLPSKTDIVCWDFPPLCAVLNQYLLFVQSLVIGFVQILNLRIVLMNKTEVFSYDRSGRPDLQ